MITEGFTVDPVAIPNARSEWKNLTWEGLPESDRGALDGAAERLEEGEVVRFRVPVDHQRKGSEKTRSHIDVIMRKRDEAGSGKPTYHRSGMWILDEQGSPLGAFDAVVIALEDGISDLLGDAENPAHTRWRLASGDFTKNWVAGGRIDHLRAPSPTAHQFADLQDRRGGRLHSRRGVLRDRRWRRGAIKAGRFR